MSRCYCSNKPFAKCCEPFISGVTRPPDAEKLMRSRFTAYCLQNYQYILDTYGKEQQASLNLESLEASAMGTKWIGLEVVEYTLIDPLNAMVEFIATYAEKKNLFQMHELSSFKLQDGFWKYTTGQMKEKTGKIKLSRNDLCPCKSGKKFKQCCMNKL